MEDIKKMKIEPQEQGEVLDLIKTYRYCNDKIAESMIEIQNLETKKNDLINTILQTRTNEKEWVGKMIGKYGVGRLNLETMEWFPDNQEPEVSGQAPVDTTGAPIDTPEKDTEEFGLSASGV